MVFQKMLEIPCPHQWSPSVLCLANEKNGEAYEVNSVNCSTMVKDPLELCAIAQICMAREMKEPLSAEACLVTTFFFTLRASLSPVSIF